MLLLDWRIKNQCEFYERKDITLWGLQKYKKWKEVEELNDNKRLYFHQIKLDKKIRDWA